jgi:AraC family transcriptional regulator, regulatory protein of adaptative response / methylated-DNA-[protein]-cysteine methyltransferase
MLRSQCETRGGPLSAVPIQTSAGVFTACFSERGLAELDFPGSTRVATGAARATDASANIRDWAAFTRTALHSILSAKQPENFPPLDVSSGTEFQQQVWSALRRIRVGHTKTYSEIASEIGSPGAARAVGSACGANPNPVLIPCHRVVASRGKLGGFSAGLDWKQRLLAIEGTCFAFA